MGTLVRLKKDSRGRGHDQKGRSRRGERFLKLDHWFLHTAAWRSLSPAPRAVYVELAQRYNGLNNGEISMSVREVAELVHIAKDTATKAFHELEEKGFIRRAVCGSFNWKLRHATTWILTAHPLGETPATKEFARWSPQQELESGPNSGTDCPRSGTLLSKFLNGAMERVLTLGPWSRSCTVPRSQTTARM
jgi:hypothetical protein